MTARDAWDIAKQTGSEWIDDKAPQLGAGLAFYSVLSLAPLLVIVLAIAGAVFGAEAARGELVSQVERFVGKEGAEAIQEIIVHAQQPGRGVVASLLGLVTLFFGASGVFGQLQDALNTVWNVKPKSGLGLWGFLRARFLSFTMVLGTGFLLLVSLVLDAALSAFSALLEKWFQGLHALLTVVNLVLSFGMVAGLFALIFKYVPDVRVGWKDVAVGAVLTALLFSLGEYALGVYLGTQGIGSAYGAAGSLVVLLVWVYYSAQILLFGAEFTQVYARHKGCDVQPSEHATWADSHDDARHDRAGQIEKADGQVRIGMG